MGLNGFKLVGIVLGLAVQSRAFGYAMGAYGGGMSLYSNFIARGARSGVPEEHCDGNWDWPPPAVRNRSRPVTLPKIRLKPGLASARGTWQERRVRMASLAIALVVATAAFDRVASAQKAGKTIRTVAVFSLLAVGLFFVTKLFYPRAGTKTPPDISIKSNRALVSNALYLPESKIFTSEIDSSVLQSVADQYNLLVIVRAPDNSIDSLDDTRIAKSDAFAITGEVRTIQIDLTEQFIQRANEAKKQFDGQPIEGFIGLIPKSVRPDQILTIRGITALGGRRIIVDSKPPIYSPTRIPSLSKRHKGAAAY